MFWLYNCWNSTSKPIRKGTILFQINLSFLEAYPLQSILAIYPVSSKIERKKNNIRINGKNDKTDPTPASIPSAINDLTISLMP